MEPPEPTREYVTAISADNAPYTPCKWIGKRLYPDKVVPSTAAERRTATRYTYYTYTRMLKEKGA